MSKSNWKVKVNAASKEQQFVPGLGTVNPGEWITLEPAQVERLERDQGRPIKELAGELFEVKTPDGKVVEPPKVEEPEAEEAKEEGS